MLSYTASPFFFIPKIFGKKLFVNPDGLEWKRDKFNFFEKQLLFFNEKMMVVWTDKIIADSNEIKKYYDGKYNVSSEFIPYWVDEVAEVKWEHDKLPDLLKGKIEINNYWLVVARLEPENNIHVIVEGYLESASKRPLIIVGNFQSKAYQERVRNIIESKAEDKQIYFTGAIYNQEILNMLRQNCFAYIHGHSVGGTNPSLLEAMMMKNIIIAHDNEFNREVCGDCVDYFKDSMALKDKFNQVDKNYSGYLMLKENAYERVIKLYSWDYVVNKYEELFSNEF
jgi:rhamnosyltransferase